MVYVNENQFNSIKSFVMCSELSSISQLHYRNLDKKYVGDISYFNTVNPLDDNFVSSIEYEYEGELNIVNPEMLGIYNATLLTYEHFKISHIYTKTSLKRQSFYELLDYVLYRMSMYTIQEVCLDLLGIKKRSLYAV